MTENLVETVLMTATENALEGTLTDDARIEILRFALNMAADEFHRIEEEESGTVDPGVLIALHQLYTVCQPNLTTDDLMAAMNIIAEMLGDDSA